MYLKKKKKNAEISWKRNHLSFFFFFSVPTSVLWPTLSARHLARNNGQDFQVRRKSTRRRTRIQREMSATGTSNCAACHDCHRCHPHSASCLSILRRTIAFNEVKLKMRRNVRPAPFLFINVAWTWADRIVARYRSPDRFIEIARLNEGREEGEEEEVLKSSGARVMTTSLLWIEMNRAWDE